MSKRETVSVQKGIWIDDRQLADAGLEGQVEISILPGEIRIAGATAKSEEPAQSEAAWAVFLSLGSDAQPGRLSNPSTEHDRYLYSEPQ